MHRTRTRGLPQPALASGTATQQPTLAAGRGLVAAHVDDLSERGIGLDAARAATSPLGHGTTFSLRLPATPRCEWQRDEERRGRGPYCLFVVTCS